MDAYIAAAPRAAQPRLRELRALIRAAAPAATEGISYGMPAYEQRGRLVWFSAFKSHIGVYPAGEAASHPELARYMTGRGTFRFPLDEPMPMDLIRMLVEARVRQNDAKAGKPEAARRGPSARSASRGGAAASRRASR